MASSSRISDLIVDSRLEVKSFGDYSIQTRHVSTAHSQQRRIREQERGQRTKHLGSGSFGVVWLETCTEGSSSGRVRAVKEIVKGTASVPVVYSRELEAIAKFSQEKVSNFKDTK
jgi:hypothetical protein